MKILGDDRNPQLKTAILRAEASRLPSEDLYLFEDMRLCPNDKRLRWEASGLHTTALKLQRSFRALGLAIKGRNDVH